MSQSRLKALGLLFSVFALGAVVGGAGLSWAEHRRAERSRPARAGDGMLTRMAAQLDLTQEQQDSIRVILKRHDPTMDSMWSEIRPRFDSLRAVVRGQIQGQLSPEQQRKYKETLERREREYRERRAATRD